MKTDTQRKLDYASNPLVMPQISVLVHAHDQERTLGRTLESVRFADEIVVVDHHSHDKTAKVARQYGARIVRAVVGVDRGGYSVDCKHDWIFCILPGETVSEELEASLQDWKQRRSVDEAGYLIPVREQSGENWNRLAPEMRLADRTKVNWPDLFPSPTNDAGAIAGDLLRLSD
jgi:glycosyltransferase involved in cell wall biosynthesis